MGRIKLHKLGNREMDFETIKNILHFLAILIAIFIGLNTIFTRRRLISRNYVEISGRLRGIANWQSWKQWILVAADGYMALMSLAGGLLLLLPPSLPRAGVLLAVFFMLSFCYWVQQISAEIRTL